MVPELSTESAATKPTAVEDPNYNQLGDLVHMDGITSPVEDESGNVGAIVFKDEATKAAFVYPYKSRIEVYERSYPSSPSTCETPSGAN